MAPASSTLQVQLPAGLLLVPAEGSGWDSALKRDCHVSPPINMSEPSPRGRMLSSCSSPIKAPWPCTQLVPDHTLPRPTSPGMQGHTSSDGCFGKWSWSKLKQKTPLQGSPLSTVTRDGPHFLRDIHSSPGLAPAGPQDTQIMDPCAPSPRRNRLARGVMH